jgi:hypothetical protein
MKPGRTDLETQHAGLQSFLDDITAEILSVCGRFLFSSVRMIARSLDIHLSTIYIHLVAVIGLKDLGFRSYVSRVTPLTDKRTDRK